jgi:hypothetical protein
MARPEVCPRLTCVGGPDVDLYREWRTMVVNRHHRTPSLTTRKTLVFGLASLVLMATLAAAELLVRLMGIPPWTNADLQIHVAPGGRFFTPHPTLGYAQLPGTFLVTLPRGYSFTVTHLPGGLRITHPLATYAETQPKPEIWIMGCSFTHGWSLNDQDTYPWLLQARLPQYEVVNYGVEGYGTLHALIQLREALTTQRRPHVVVYAYASLHDERNTFLRDRRKTIAPRNRLGPLLQPYVRLDRHGHLRADMATVEYTEFPFMRYSAFVHLLEMTYNGLEDAWSHSHQVSQRLVLEMAELAEQYHVKLVLATIAEDARSREMLAFAQAQGLMGVDISVNSNRHEYTNGPHDSHPSPLANLHYAERLETFLRTGVLGKDHTPADRAP